MISLIWAMGRNRVIGINNRLPWKLPADLAYFKRITMGRTVIMGRKTFESIGKPLPGRKNVIITRELDYSAHGCIICHSIEEVLQLVKDEEAFVIGGADVYSGFLQYARKLYLTLIDEEFEADTFFPEFEESKWVLESKTYGETDEKNPYDYCFMIYEKSIDN